MDFIPLQQNNPLAVPDSQSIFSDLFDYSTMAGSSSFIDSPVGLTTKEDSGLLGGPVDSLFPSDFSSSFMTESLGSEQDWLAQSMPLPTPEEQRGDLLAFTSPLPPTSLATTGDDLDLSFLPTPDTSLPSSPESIPTSQSSPASFYSEEDEINDVMSSMLGNESFVPHQMLPLSSPFSIATSHDLYCSSPQDTFISSPGETYPIASPGENYPIASPGENYPIASPALSGMSATSPIVIDDDSELIRGLLKAETKVKSSCAETESLSMTSRKRKVSIAQDEEEVKLTRPAPKRRMNQATKRERKREQNKTAALRYRKRKKGEKSEVEVRRQELVAKNNGLQSKVDSLSTEISYLKQLWSEVQQTKKLRQMRH